MTGDDADGEDGNPHSTGKGKFPKPELKYVYTMHLTLGTPIQVNGPNGHRFIWPDVKGTFEGANMKGTVGGPAGDWATLRPDGTITLDARFMLTTDDGAIIYKSVSGRSDRETGLLTSSAEYETGDEKYAFLHRQQLIGYGFKTGYNASIDYYICGREENKEEEGN